MKNPIDEPRRKVTAKEREQWKEDFEEFERDEIPFLPPVTTPYPPVEVPWK